MADPQGMPTHYDTQTTTQQTTTTSSQVGLQIDYVKSIPGILKIVEIVVSIVTFICASIRLGWVPLGGGWVQFVSMTAFISTFVFFIFHFLNIISKIPANIPWNLIEFIYYCIFTGLYLIAAIVAAARGNLDPSIGATAFFGFVATVVYGIDTFFQFRNWRSGPTQMVATANTTTTTTVESRHQTY